MERGPSAVHWPVRNICIVFSEGVAVIESRFGGIGRGDELFYGCWKKKFFNTAGCYLDVLPSGMFACNRFPCCFSRMLLVRVTCCWSCVSEETWEISRLFVLFLLASLMLVYIAFS